MKSVISRYFFCIQVRLMEKPLELALDIDVWAKVFLTSLRHYFLFQCSSSFSWSLLFRGIS